MKTIREKSILKFIDGEHYRDYRYPEGCNLGDIAASIITLIIEEKGEKETKEFLNKTINKLVALDENKK